KDELVDDFADVKEEYPFFDSPFLDASSEIKDESLDIKDEPIDEFSFVKQEEPNTDISLGNASPEASAGGINTTVSPRRPGRNLMDVQLAASNGPPLPAAEIAELSLSEMHKLLKDDSLTELQRQLIRTIRRRALRVYLMWAAV
ncbi:hypothetical protein PMAYCL1PPCAC_27895, partial [Pristionchus mayeri]